MINYYKILKVEPTATKDDIKLSYRKMAQKHHPDKSRNNHSERRFKEINEAYHTLMDVAKRKNYDQQFILYYNSTNGGKLIWIYIFVLIAVFSFILWYLSNLSLNTP
jgi:DnaJ-class molecular chaperone